MPRADCATYDSAITDARASCARAVASSKSSNGLYPQMGASIARPACTSTRTSPGWIRRGDGSARGQSGPELAVHQQAPHFAERHPLVHQILDIDAAVAQRAAVFIRLGNLGGEGNDAVEARDEIFRDHSHGKILAPHRRADATGR